MFDKYGIIESFDKGLAYGRRGGPQHQAIEKLYPTGYTADKHFTLYPGMILAPHSRILDPA